MDTLRQIGGSLLLALFSAALVIGGISLALAESNKPEIPEPPTETQVLIQILNSPTPVPQKTVTATNMVSPSSTLIATMPSTSPTPYVSPPPTKTLVPCGPPTGWIRYSVQAGNTMYSLSLAYGVSVSELQRANCMTTDKLTTGQTIWVPNVITRTPRASFTPSLTPVSIVFPTITKPATITPTPTQTAPPTMTPTVPPTFTQTATVPSPTTPPTATATITAFPTSNP